MLHEAFIIMYCQLSIINQSTTADQKRVIRVSCTEYVNFKFHNLDRSITAECINCGAPLQLDEETLEVGKKMMEHQLMAGCQQIRNVVDMMITTLPLSRPTSALFYNIQGGVELVMFLICSGEEKSWYV